jgi:hypothetical protein
MGLLAIDFLFMKSVFCEQLLFKSGFINNSIITLQILSLCVLQIKRELRIKCGVEVKLLRVVCKYFLGPNMIKFLWWQYLPIL